MKPTSRNLQTVRSHALRIAGGMALVSLGAWSAPALSASPILGEISVNIGVEGPPPPPQHEVIIESSRPGPDYIWVGGFWDGAPGHYTWTGGHWDRPPHGHAGWVAPHWDRDHDGHYHQVKGEWR